MSGRDPSRDKIDTLIEACDTALCYVGEDTPLPGSVIGTLIEVVDTIVVGEGPGKYSRDKIDTLIDACCTALCYVGEDTPRLGDQGGTIVFCRGGIREG